MRFGRRPPLLRGRFAELARRRRQDADDRQGDIASRRQFAYRAEWPGRQLCVIGRWRPAARPAGAGSMPSPTLPFRAVYRIAGYASPSHAQVPSPTLQFRAAYMLDGYMSEARDTLFQAPHFNSGLSTAPTEARCASTDPGVIFERCLMSLPSGASTDSCRFSIIP